MRSVTRTLHLSINF